MAEQDLLKLVGRIYDSVSDPSTLAGLASELSSEFSCDMISRISNTEPRTYLSFFARYGYAIHIISRVSGQIELVADIDALLRDWGSWWR